MVTPSSLRSSIVFAERYSGRVSFITFFPAEICVLISFCSSDCAAVSTVPASRDRIANVNFFIGRQLLF